MPAIGGFLGLIAFDFIDIVWIEKLGNTAVAAVASAGFIIASIYSLMQITSAGCSSLVAQFYGANSKSRCWHTVIQSTWCSLAFGICVTALGVPLVNLPFASMGLDAESSRIAAEYFKILLYGMPFIFLDMLFNSIFNAYGDNKVSTVIMLFSLFINAVLDPIFMFGWCGVPRMEVQGAAWATLTGHFISFLLRAYFLRKKNYIPPLRYFFNNNTCYIKEILKIGIPNAATSWVWSLVYPVLMRYITPFGTIHVSAIGICHRLEDFPYFFAQGFSVAMTALVGFYVGKNEKNKIDIIVDGGICMASMLVTPFVLLCLFFPANLFSLVFVTDPVLIEAGASYIFIIGIFEIFMTFENVLTGVFTGLGKTFPVMCLTTPITIGRIPLAWYMAFKLNMGIEGVWWAISITTMLKGLGLMLLYKYYSKKF